MIITREIVIKINEANFSYYENMGYDDITIGEELLIPVELLSKGSHYRIKCKCDSCGLEKDVIFKNYIKYNPKTQDISNIIDKNKKELDKIDPQ